MIVLPKGAFVVEKDVEETQVYGVSKTKNTGTIVFTSEELKQYQGCKVKFRESFSEEVDIEQLKKLLFFRDFDSSIFYVITD